MEAIDLFGSELLTAGFALFGISAAILAQCGGNKRPEKKKLSSQQASSKSKRVSGKSKRSARSQRSQRAASQKGPVSARAPSAKRSGKSKRSSRKSKRSTAEKSARSSKIAPLKSDRGLATAKSDRSSKEVATAKSLDASKQQGTSFKGSKDQYELNTAREQQPGALKSLKDSAEAKLDFTQKALSQEKSGNALVELQMEPRELKFDEKGGLQKVQLHNPSNVRQAIKVKCSDNSLYRVNPVYGLIEPGQSLSLHVVRRAGNAKLDKIVILTSEAPDAADADIRGLFKKQAAGTYKPMMVLPLMA